MCESSPGYLDLCQAPQRSEVVRGDFGQRRCGGSCVAYVHACLFQMLAAPALDLRLQKVLLENKQRGSAPVGKQKKVLLENKQRGSVGEEIQQGAGHPKMSEADVLRESDEVLTTRLKKEFNRCFLNYQHVAEQYKWEEDQQVYTYIYIYAYK